MTERNEPTGQNAPRGRNEPTEPNEPARQDEATRQTGPARLPAAASAWTRLRAAPGAALAFAALLLVTAFTAASLPRLVDGYENDALRETLTEAPLSDRLVSATTAIGPDNTGDAPRELVQPSAVDRSAAAYRKAIRSPLPAEKGKAVYGVHNQAPADALDAGMPRPSPERSPQTTLVAQPDLAGHSRLVDGRMPGSRVTGPPGSPRVEAVLTEATAKRMKVRTGDSFELAGLSDRVTVKVTGLVSPRSPKDIYWRAEQSLTRPTLMTVKPPGPGSEPLHFWHFSAFIDRDATAALFDIKGGAEIFWHQPLRTEGMRAHEVDALRDTLASLTSGPDATRLEKAAAVGPVAFDEGLGELLTGFEEERAAVEPLLLMAELGLATAAVTVLLLWGVLAAERRRAELDLLRSRGSSLRGLAGHLLAETLTTGLPAAALGTAAALLVTEEGRWGPALWMAAGVTALAVLTLPVRAVLAHRRPHVLAERAGLLHGRRSRRRIVAELTALVLVVGAVVALRQRGADSAGEGSEPDPLLAAAPVLLAVAVALVLIRLYPLPLRLLTRPAARSRGAVGFLGMARAARAPSAAVAGLPLLALLVALTVASFGGTVLAGIADGRDEAALRTVGADARIDSVDTVPGPVLTRIRETGGVEEAITFRTFDAATVTDDSSGLTASSGATVVIAEPDAYARLADRTGAGPFSPDELRLGKEKEGLDTPVPALVSAELARKMGEQSSVSVPGLSLTVRPALVRESTPAVRGDFVVVSRKAVEQARPDTAGTALVRPNALLLSGDSVDGAALRKLAAGQNGMTVDVRADRRDSYSDSVLQSGAERLYIGAVLAAAGFSALAVLLSLLQTAQDRITLLARLRTMGLPRRQGRRLLLLESLPVYVLTAVAGVLTALASVPLLRPGIDLSTLAGTPADDPVRLGTDPVSLALPPLCLLTLACSALLVQARVAARRTDLRMEPL